MARHLIFHVPHPKTPLVGGDPVPENLAYRESMSANPSLCVAFACHGARRCLFFFLSLSIQFTHFILLIFAWLSSRFSALCFPPLCIHGQSYSGAAASHHHCLLLVLGCSTEFKKTPVSMEHRYLFFVTKSLPEREVGIPRYRILSKRWIKRSNYLHYLSIYLRYGYTISGTGILSRLESHRASGGGQCSPDPQIPHRRLGSFPIELLGYNLSCRMSHVASPSHLSTCWLQRCRCGEVSFE